ncbi:MAG: hypothetical protein ACMUIU_13495 [bacterium]
MINKRYMMRLRNLKSATDGDQELKQSTHNLIGKRGLIPHNKGIGSFEIFRYLKDIGCEYIPGYYDPNSPCM